MYTIIGGDRQEYGPATADEIRQWVADGRANGQTQAREENGPWRPLASFPEFASLFGAVPLPPSLPSRSVSNPPPVPNYLVAAILCTLCFCVPMGIAAIVYAAQVNPKLAAGDRAGAEQASRKAKGWCIASLIAGIVVLVIYFLSGAAAGAADKP